MSIQDSSRNTRSGLIAALTIAVGITFFSGVAFAANNWIVGLNPNSTASAQAASITNLTVAQVTPVGTLTNQLFPGGTGDVQIKVTNPNNFPVTITAISIPASTANAVGYSDPTLTTAVAGCNSGSSTVSWNGNVGTRTLTTPLVVAASNAATPLVVTLTNSALMQTGAPLACAGLYFSMPSLTGVTATGFLATPTVSPATDTYSLTA